jgi:hypothetical protein
MNTVFANYVDPPLSYRQTLVPETFYGNSNMNCFFFPFALSPHLGLGLPPWNSPFGLLNLRRSVGLLARVISSSQGPYFYTNTKKKHTPNIHALSEIRTLDPGFRASEDSTCLRPLGYRDRLSLYYCLVFLPVTLLIAARHNRKSNHWSIELSGQTGLRDGGGDWETWLQFVGLLPHSKSPVRLSTSPNRILTAQT